MGARHDKPLDGIVTVLRSGIIPESSSDRVSRVGLHSDTHRPHAHSIGYAHELEYDKRRICRKTACLKRWYVSLIRRLYVNRVDVRLIGLWLLEPENCGNDVIYLVFSKPDSIVLFKLMPLLKCVIRSACLP